MKVKKVIAGALAFAITAISLPQLDRSTNNLAAVDYYGDFKYYLTGNYDLEEDNYFYTVAIAGYTGTGGDVEIPDTIDGMSVTDIGNYAFSDCASITSITIPSSVRYIGMEAFRNCSSITSIAISDSVSQIGGYFFDETVFMGCSSLTKIEVDPNNSKYSSTEGVLYNKEQSKLICYPAGKEGETFIIPDSVTDIGSNAFTGCTPLASVDIPDSVTKIGYSAFSDCTSIVSVVIPDSVTEIGYSYSNIFAGCSSLTKIEVDADNSAYMSSNGVLYNKEQTTLICYPAGKEGETFLIPDSVTEIGYSAFFDCTSLASVFIPDSVKEIGNYAFSGCTSIISFTIPSGIESIGERAFKNCTALERVNFLGNVPCNNLRSDDWGCFSECALLAEINVDESSSEYSSIDGVLYNKDQTKLIFCPPGYSGVLVIPDSVIVIDGRNFSHCPLLTAFDADESNTVFSSKEGVLYNKDKSQLIAYPRNIEGAFTVPDGVRSIGINAFVGCQVEAVTLPDGVTSIGGGAFSGCVKLKSINLPDSLTDIGWYAFASTGLTEVTIPNSTTSIGTGAFSWSGLYSIVIPSSVTFIDEQDNVFRGCPSSYFAPEGSPEFLTIYGEAGSYAETYAAKYDINFEEIKLIAPNKDNDSDIEVIVDPDAVPDGTAVNVTEKDRTEVSVTFDITLTVNGEAIQLNGSARVKIPVPSGWNADDCKIYRKEEDGTYTDMKAKAIGTFLSFITDHFSEYIITTAKLPPDAVLGDVNGDRTVNDQDSMLLSRYLAEWGNEIDIAAADINGDGRVNDQDGIVLARKLAGWYD